MVLFEWNEDKNEWLQRERGISFEDIEIAVGEGRMLADIDNPSSKYPHQKILVVRVGRRAYAAPYVLKNEKIHFLKTAYPSRKYTKQFLKVT